MVTFHWRWVYLYEILWTYLWTVLKLYNFVTETTNVLTKFKRTLLKTYQYKSYGSCTLALRLMLVNICMKFHDTLNGFKVTERKWLVTELLITNFKSTLLKEIHTQELWFLHSACHLLLLNICMKFYEYILNSFKVIERRRLCQETDIWKAHVTQTISIQELWFIWCLIFVWSFMKISWKAWLLLWFLAVTCSCCLYLYVGSPIMWLTYFS